VATNKTGKLHLRLELAIQQEDRMHHLVNLAVETDRMAVAET